MDQIPPRRRHCGIGARTQWTFPIDTESRDSRINAELDTDSSAAAAFQRASQDCLGNAAQLISQDRVNVG